MKKLLVAAMLGWLGLIVWHRVTRAPAAVAVHHSAGPAPDVQAVEATAAAPVSFSCDGRTRCSEMRSCDEARFFLRSCTGVKMDGDGDGLPCEDVCGHDQ